MEMEARTLAAINEVFHEALICGSDEHLGKICLKAAEGLTGSVFGLLLEVNDRGTLDTIAMSDPGWKACHMPGSEALRRLNGMPIRGIFAAPIRAGEIIICNDPPNHAQSRGVPEGHPELTSFLGVPLRMGGRIFGLIGLGNKPGGYTEADGDAVQSLSRAIVEALASKRSEMALEQRRQELERLMFRRAEQSREELAEVRASERKFRDLFTHAQVGLFRLAVESMRVLVVNDEVCRITERSQAEMLEGDTLLRWVDGADQDRWMEQLMEQKEVRTFKAQVQSATGMVRTLLISAKHFAEEGLIEGSIVDVTDG